MGLTIHALPWPMWIIAAGDVVLLGGASFLWLSDRVAGRPKNAASQCEAVLGSPTEQSTEGGEAHDCSNNQEKGAEEGNTVDAATAGFCNSHDHVGRRVQPAHDGWGHHLGAGQGNARRDSRADSLTVEQGEAPR